MTIKKNTDLEFSLQKGTEKGGVYTNFYTEDKGSASIRIRLSSNGYYLDLTKTDLKPVLFLFHEDGSIFEIKDFINVMLDKGLIQYNLSDNVIRHAGRVKAKLFLKNTKQSVHVANFTFDIKDSGIEGAVAKEVNVNIVDDAVRRIVKENAIEILGDDFEERLNTDVINHLDSNPDLFKGDKGDAGEQGLQGEKGAKGDKGEQGDIGPSPDMSDFENEKDFLTLKQNEKSFMKFLKDNSVQTSNNTISLLSDRNIKIELPLNNNEKFTLTMSKNINDDFIKFRNADYTSETKTSNPQTYDKNYDDSMVSNGSLSGSGDNCYATTIGTKVTFTFTGSSITFRYYTDNRGGVWKASIDGTFIKNVSTHLSAQSPEQIVAPSVGENLIKEDMKDTEHTLVLEFIGQDENYPIDKPRGWIRKDSDPVEYYNRYTFSYFTSQANVTSVTKNALYDSNKEFAFDVVYNDTREWIPEHNNTGTLKLSDEGNQSLFIDGVEYSINNPLEEKTFTEVKILQNLFGINSSSGEKVCQLICVSTITSQGVKFNTKVIWLKEVTIRSGYVNMFTISPEFADTLVTSYDTKHRLDIYDNSYVDLTEKAPYSFATTSSKFTDMYLTCDNIDAYKTLRMDYTDRAGDKYGKDLFALQHRNEKLQKIYPKVYENHVTQENEVYKFEGFFGFGKLPMANNILR